MSTRSDTPSLLRRLAAIVYDTLLLIGVLFLATALALVMTIVWLGSERVIEHNPLVGNPLFSGYLVAISFLFFGWFWTHGGQTLGMKAWKMRVVDNDNRSLDWSDAGKRFAAAGLSWATLGLGFLWQYLDRDRLTWHDRLSGTRLMLTRPPK